MKIKLVKASPRNTRAYKINIDNKVELYFSYETCVAINYKGGFYRSNEWYSKTTTRHMKEMYVFEWPKLSERDFENHVKTAITEIGLAAAKEVFRS